MESARLVLVAVIALAVSGCASFYPVSPTTNAIRRQIEPGDTVRVLSRERGELKLLVIAIGEHEMRGRVSGNSDDVVRLPYDRIEELEVQHLNMRRTLLGVVLPVVVGAIIACNGSDCRTRSTVDARF